MERPAGKASTRRGKQALADKEPKIVENPKSALYVRGSNCSQEVQDVFRDLHSITKPNSVIFSKKHEVRPFEDVLPLENMSAQQDVSLFAFGSHNKKRPHNITFVRMFDFHVLDMVELGVTNLKLMSEFKNSKFMLGSKPCLAFLGSLFTTNLDYARIKNLLADFFRGPIVENVNLSGLDHALVFTATETAILMRQYRISLKKSGTRLPLADLEEIGPSIDFVVRRTQWPSEDLLKLALRVPKEAKVHKVKNISHNETGEEIGRLHLEKQDLSKLQTRKVKALKRKPAEKGAPKKRSRDDKGDSDVAEAQEMDE